MVVLELLVRLLNVSFDMGVVPMDWRGACIVPLYKDMRDKYNCDNSRGISLLRVVGKLYGRVLIKELGPELNMQSPRSNMGLGRVEDAWIKCLPQGRCVKSI